MDNSEEEKLPRALGPEDKCDFNPEFAVICSFINKFGQHIDMSLNIEELKNSIENQETLDDSLVDIHVKLLRKQRRYFVPHRWEMALMKFAYQYSYDDGYEIETMGYLKARPSIKLRLLRRLLDEQFECDPKFKAAINNIDANELNTKPTGRDTNGNTYWSCADDHGNLRIYREEPLQHKSWTAICKNTDDLKLLIEHLEVTKDVKVKGEPQPEPYNPYPEIFPEYFIKEEEEKESNDNKVETETKKTSRKNTRKGKKKGRSSKKSSTLETVNEDDEQVTQVEDKSIINTNQDQQPGPLDDHPRSLSPNGSIESHVKFTLENILSKVVSSFDYIFRRKSPDVTQDKVENSTKRPRERSRKREKPKAEELPRRSSSRIQQLQQKKVEEEATKKLIQETIAKSTSEPSSKEPSKSDCLKTSTRDKKDKQRWRNSRGKKRISWDKDDSDLSSISSPSESNDESFLEALNESNDHENDEDEFACEDEVSNDEPVIIKRARTARQTLELEATNDLNGSSIIEEDKPCGRCDKSNDPDWILLCDMCDDGYHTTCCVPPLMYVPDGDWFCPPCEQKMLLQKLKEICESVTELRAIRERERLKKQKLRQPAPKKEIIRTRNEELVPDKRRRDILNELNEPLAVQRLDEELASSPGEELPSSYREGSSRLPKKKLTKKAKRKKTKSMRYDSEEDESDYELDKHYKKKKYSRSSSDSEFVDDFEDEEDFIDDEEFSESSSNDGEQLKTRKARAFVSYKFEEYDELIQSAICGDSDEERNRRERSSSDTCNVGRGKDMATIEALAYQQENGLSGELAPVKAPKQRKKGRKLNDLDADSELDIATSDESFQGSSATQDLEDEDEDETTEVSLEEDSSIDEIVCMYRSKSKAKKNKKTKRKRFSDDSEDSDFKPRTRRVAAQRISYKESSDDEDELVATKMESEPMTQPDPINQLTQYCSQSSYPSNPLFSSFKMSPPHPQFYKEDEVKSLSNDE